jgi:hypothetical protein
MIDDSKVRINFYAALVKAEQVKLLNKQIDIYLGIFLYNYAKTTIYDTNVFNIILDHNLEKYNFAFTKKSEIVLTINDLYV